DQMDANLGCSVAGAGDVNGDGYDDVVVGAYRYDTVETDDGAAFVFHGGPSGVPSGTPATAAVVLFNGIFPSAVGRSVASAGDVNGDGYPDLIVGAPGYHNPDVEE